MKRFLKILFWLVAIVLVVGLSLVGYYFFKLKSDIVNNKTEASQKSIEEKYGKEDFTKNPSKEAFFQAYTFDMNQFAKPPKASGPFTRWWWPGNDVEKKELQRELKLFSKVGLAGVEIQAFTMGLNLKTTSEAQLKRIYSWDSPSFYDNLATVMETAKAEGLTVDLNNGSGWPTGGPQIALEDNLKSLMFSEVSKEGGKTISWEVALPKPRLSNYVVSSLRMSGFFNIQGSRLRPKEAKLVAVVAAPLLKSERSMWVNRVTDQVFLDTSKALDLTKYIKKNKLTWKAPKGKWHIVAFWSLPNDEHPILLAKKNTGYVLDHFDAQKVIANYNYLFGKRSKLSKYYGKPFRAIFNDSYEFKAERHYSEDFFDVFKQSRGYDIRPLLPAVMAPGYNHMIAHLTFSHAKPAFVFSAKEDWRLQYDYDLTISDLLIDKFLKPSMAWTEKRGLQHRTQAYGLKMDVMSASGNAHLPEAEQLFGEGSEGFLKVVSSGASLHNRPLVSAESVVYRDRAYMTSPEKIKLSVDKAFTSGINQIIYHGTSYQYKNKAFGKYGWFPWSSPYSKGDFSMDLDEDNPFWKYLPQLNDYIRRSQYALQSGKAKAEVLIYYPFLGFGYGEDFSNPKEILKGGRDETIEGPASDIPKIPLVSSRKPKPKDLQTEWFLKTWDIIDKLEAQGITWTFVNDKSLQLAKAKNKKWSIRGNTFQALLLPHTPYIQTQTAKKLKILSQKGLQTIIIGESPQKQPSYLDFKKKDKLIQSIFEQILAQENCQKVVDVKSLSNLLETIEKPFDFEEKYNFLRQVQRVMPDDSRVRFLRNRSNKWQTIRLRLNKNYATHFWLNPENGNIVKIDKRQETYTLPPYGTVILYSQKSEASIERKTSKAINPFPSKTIQTLREWQVKAGKLSFISTSLFDWKDKEKWKYLGIPATYKTSFKLAKVDKDKAYFLDLGKVYFTAEVTINQQKLPPLLYSPYIIRLDKYLKEGKNTIIIKTQPTLRNMFIGKAKAGDKHYKQFKKKGNTTTSAGLLGPVRILKSEGFIKPKPND